MGEKGKGREGNLQRKKLKKIYMEAKVKGNNRRKEYKKKYE